MGRNPSTHMQTQALSPTGTRMAVLLGNEATTHPPSGLSTTNTYLLHRSGSNELLYDARLLGQISLDGLYVRAITLKAQHNFDNLISKISPLPASNSSSPATSQCSSPSRRPFMMFSSTTHNNLQLLTRALILLIKIKTNALLALCLRPSVFFSQQVE